MFKLLSYFSLFTTFLFIHCIVNAQILTITPDQPSLDELITVIYDATEGNGELTGETSDVYTYTGLITSESVDDHDWKYIKSGWCVNDPDVLMERTETNIYEISFVINDFYGIPEGTEVLKLAFLFRNEDCSLVGRDVGNEDIFYVLDGSTIGEYESHEIDGNLLTITDTETNVLHIQAFSEHSIKVIYQEPGETVDSSYSVIQTPDTTINAAISITENTLEYSIGNTALTIHKDNLLIDYHYDGNLMISEDNVSIANGDQYIGLTVDADEKFFGAGSRAIAMDRNNRTLHFYNQPQYGYGYGAENLNIAIPFILSSKEYALFFDNHQPSTLDMNDQTSGKLRFKPEKGTLQYWVIFHDNYESIVKEFTSLTGFQPLPPRWSLGYIQSRFGYENETQARDVVETMLEENFPLDALVLDLYWFGGISDMGNLEWDETRFPEHEAMIADFKEEGVETILITETYFTQQSSNYNYLDQQKYFALDQNGETYVLNNFWAGAASLLDIFNPAAKAWMWPYYESPIIEGVAGWWCDLGEPEAHPNDMVHINGSARQVHNVYSLEWAKFLHDEYQENYPDKRLFNLIRSGYAGMQRYAAFPWSGDVQRSFDGLKAQIPIMLGMSLCGVGYMSSDLGGFTGSQNAELYTRWMQFGTFTPIMRPHGVDEPTEPIYYDESTKDIIRGFAQLRHRLMPYNYSLAWKNSTEGTPIVKPLFYIDKSSQAYQYMDSEYLWGDFLIAPVFEQGATNRQVYFPEGYWINFWNDYSFSGGTTESVYAPLNRIPVYVKAGSIVPMANDFLTMKDYHTDSLIIHYYPDNSIQQSGFTMYHDDGISKKYLTGDFEFIHFDFNFSQNQMELNFGKEGDYQTVETRIMEFIIHRMEEPSSVKYNEVLLTESDSGDDYQNQNNAYFWDETNLQLLIKVNWEETDGLIEIDDAVISSPEIIADKTTKFQLLYYPNPTTGVVNYELLNYDFQEISLQLVNVNGKKVFTESISGKDRKTKETIDMSTLQPGVYFLYVVSKQFNQSYKIIKY